MKNISHEDRGVYSSIPACVSTCSLRCTTRLRYTTCFSSVMTVRAARTSLHLLVLVSRYHWNETYIVLNGVIQRLGEGGGVTRNPRAMNWQLYSTQLKPAAPSNSTSLLSTKLAEPGAVKLLTGWWGDPAGGPPESKKSVWGIRPVFLVKMWQIVRSSHATVGKNFFGEKVVLGLNGLLCESL